MNARASLVSGETLQIIRETNNNNNNRTLYVKLSPSNAGFNVAELMFSFFLPRELAESPIR